MTSVSWMDQRSDLGMTAKRIYNISATNQILNNFSLHLYLCNSDPSDKTTIIIMCSSNTASEGGNKILFSYVNIGWLKLPRTYFQFSVAILISDWHILFPCNALFLQVVPALYVPTKACMYEFLIHPCILHLLPISYMLISSPTP